MSDAAASPRVPLFDIRLSEEEIGAVADALRSGWLTMGPRTEAFEQTFAEHLGVRHAVLVSSCTAALHLACLAAGVGRGDEVIVPAITFVASANAVRYCGARPVLADVAGPDDLGIDPEHVEALITPRTRAVMAVHYGGYAADVERLEAICDAHGLALLEDAAHSPSARARDSDRRLGSIGLVGAFSFFSNKVLSCGEGGLFATDYDGVAAFARSARSHALTSGTWDRHRGHSASYDVTAVGFNYRIDEARAALLQARMPGLEDDIAARRRLVHRYRDLLTGIDTVTIPYGAADVERSSCYVMPILVDPELDRDAVRDSMRSRGVQTSVLYPAIHTFAAYRDWQGAPLPRSELVARTQLTLPLYPHLSDDDQLHVVASLRAALEEQEGARGSREVMTDDRSVLL